MPSSQAILFDIHERKLDPTKAHRSLDRTGRLAHDVPAQPTEASRKFQDEPKVGFTVPTTENIREVTVTSIPEEHVVEEEKKPETHEEKDVKEEKNAEVPAASVVTEEVVEKKTRRGRNSK